MNIEILNHMKANLALWLTALALGFFAVGVGLFTAQIFSSSENESASVAAANPADEERTFLLRQKIWLMARINLCDQERQGRVPDSRSVCPGEEQDRLPEYRQKILEIDRRLNEL